MPFVAVEPRTINSATHSRAITTWRLVNEQQAQSMTLQTEDHRPVPTLLLQQSLDKLFPQLSSRTDRGPSPERIEQCLAVTPTFNLFIATENDPDDNHITRIVGCATLVVISLLMATRAHIEDVVVLDEYRGLGLGRGLMQCVIHEAEHVHGCENIDLTSRPDRVQARQLYESLGFKLRDTGAFRCSLNRSTT
ncbi:hypothetical protein BGZ94_010087 [Podila epigama]|nr:hypothetical protein BGZ94_010087 [Podila epigama]